MEKCKSRILKYKSYLVESNFDIDQLLNVIKALYNFELNDIQKNTYIHADLYSRHLLVDSNKQLTGIIDWGGDVNIGNPGTDLCVGYMILSDEALNIFFDNYGTVTNQMNQIALLRAFCHSIVVMGYSFEKNEENLKQWTIIALKRAIENINHYSNLKNGKFRKIL